jgi:predicted patatin/cPLA2 family phospholipase
LLSSEGVEQRKKITMPQNDFGRQEGKNFTEIPETLERYEFLAKRIQILKKLVQDISIKILMTERETALLLSVDQKWLQRKRLEGKPPYFFKIGEGAIRYNLLEVLDYIDSCKRHSTSEQERAGQ